MRRCKLKHEQHDSGECARTPASRASRWRRNQLHISTTASPITSHDALNCPPCQLALALFPTLSPSGTMAPPARRLRLALLAVVALLSFLSTVVHAASGEKLQKSRQHPLKGSIDKAKAREACPDYTSYARHRQ